MSTPTTKLKRHGDTMRGALAWSGTDFVGLEVQSLTTVQRDATSPNNGAVVYNSDDAKFQMRVGGAWSNIASEGYASEATDWKASVICATTANISLTGEQTIDGVTTSADRILVKDQSTGSENGIYVTAAGAWARADDFDTDAEVTAGATMFISQGATLGNTTYQLTTDDAITVGTTALVFAQIAGGGFSGVPQSEPSLENLFIGTNAGAGAITLQYCTLIGYDCCTNLNTGDANTVVGANCGGAMTTAQNNCFFGNGVGASVVGGDSNVLIGAGANCAAEGNLNICIGFGANSGGGANTMFGCASPTYEHCFGVRAYLFSSDNQIVFGGASTVYFDDVYIGNGIVNAAPVGFTLQPTGGEGTDIAGADLTLAAGKGTGSALGGDIYFQTTAAGGTGTTLRTLATVGHIRASDTTLQVTKMRNTPELEQTLTDQASVDWDGDSGANATVTIAGNRTMAAPTNIKNGGRYTLHIIQDPTGTRTMGWNTVFKFAGGSTPTLSTGGNDIDIFQFVARGGNLEETNQSLNVS